jgi:hypothetical protein
LMMTLPNPVIGPEAVTGVEAAVLGVEVLPVPPTPTPPFEPPPQPEANTTLPSISRHIFEIRRWLMA